MARPGRKRKNPEMMPTMLRTAFLAYVRVLLCLQGMYLVLLGLVFFTSAGGGGTSFGRMLAVALVAALLGVVEISTAFLLRRGRRGTAIAAIVIEALWTAAAVAGYEVSLSGAPVWQYFAGAALFLVAVIGLLLPPVRAYAGLVRR